MPDEIMDELDRIREAHAAEFNYDINALYADIKRREADSGRPYVSFGPRRVETLVAADEGVPRGR